MKEIPIPWFNSYLYFDWCWSNQLFIICTIRCILKNIHTYFTNQIQCIELQSSPCWSLTSAIYLFIFLNLRYLHALTQIDYIISHFEQHLYFKDFVTHFSTHITCLLQTSCPNYFMLSSTYLKLFPKSTSCLAP